MLGDGPDETGSMYVEGDKLQVGKMGKCRSLMVARGGRGTCMAGQSAVNDVEARM